jgi:hypothetical protein
VIDRVPRNSRAVVSRALELLHDAYVAELADSTPDSARVACATT